MKMRLTFEWTDNRRGEDNIVDEREFDVKDEADVKKDISAWVKEMYAADKGKHQHFEVCRRYKMGTERCWIVYGNKRVKNWGFNFMSWAVLVLACTMNYLGWERDIETDQFKGSGYTFVSQVDVKRHFKTLQDLDKFIQEEMKGI